MAANEKKVLSVRLGEAKGNVLIIDPNKVEVNDITLGEKRVEHRFVPQEELVMYAGLKAFSKGKSSVFENNEKETVIDFGEIAVNMLNPKETLDTYKNMFTAQWTDVFVDQGPADVMVDPETFGIQSIELTQNASLVPRIKIEFVDVRGKTLLERGDDDNNPYNLFYSIPYPTFMLTLKGYYGKALTFPLVLLKTNTRFDPGTGNYHISCEFLGRTFSIFNDFLMIYAVAAPYMYEIPSKDGELKYEGMELLEWMYNEQNIQIRAEAKEKGLDLNSDAVQNRIIEKPITIYDLLDSVQNLYYDDMTDFSEEGRAVFEARGVLDGVKERLETAFANARLFFEVESNEYLKYGNGYWYFADPKKTIKDFAGLQGDLAEINSIFANDLVNSSNSKVLEIKDAIVNSLNATPGLKVYGTQIVYEALIASKSPEGQYQMTLKKFDNTLDKIMEVIDTEYAKLTSYVLKEQRSAIRNRLGFDINMENVSRVFMNNMQVFLMLLNLTTKKAFYDIVNRDGRWDAQKRDAEWIPDGSEGKGKMFPWPNYYKRDAEKFKAGEEVWKRAYPGEKVGNKTWPEVDFVEEIYKALDRIKVKQEPQGADAKYTALASPFLNQASLEQYHKIDKFNTSVEILQKIAISLTHDGVLFKSFTDDAMSKGALSNVATAFAANDYKALQDKIKSGKVDPTVVYNELKYIEQTLLSSNNYQDEAENLRVVLYTNINVDEANRLIAAEAEAFGTGDVAKLKKATEAFYEDGKPKILKDPNIYGAALLSVLWKETDPMNYVNYEAENTGTRSSRLDKSTSANNAKYRSDMAVPTTLVDGKTHPFDLVSGISVVDGFNSNLYQNLKAFDHKAFEANDRNMTVNGVPALTFNSGAGEQGPEKKILKKYSKY